LHDIGKSLIDRNILNKKGALNSSEWSQIREHPAMGVRLLQDLKELKEEALVIVEGHHEKLDGSGYPHTLRGDAVHPYARIAALADVFDALTTRRPYKVAQKTFTALQIMRDEMAHALDQELFREFVLLFRSTDPAQIHKIDSRSNSLNPPPIS
jgi:HD-GYP domain-containing protein (c-di-GMP phosphodiesterase class II)